eukprot:3151541-Prymnesium_polylepis.2
MIDEKSSIEISPSPSVSNSSIIACGFRRCAGRRRARMTARSHARAWIGANGVSTPVREPAARRRTDSRLAPWRCGAYSAARCAPSSPGGTHARE